jgi:hypothetical protein
LSACSRVVRRPSAPLSAWAPTGETAGSTLVIRVGAFCAGCSILNAVARRASRSLNVGAGLVLSTGRGFTTVALMILVVERGLRVGRVPSSTARFRT